MNMHEFYKKYKINKCDFASIAGVGKRTLIKFAEGKPIRESSRLRIETAMRVAEKYNLVRPEYDYGKALFMGVWYNSDFHREVRKYEERFKELIKRESA